MHIPTGRHAVAAACLIAFATAAATYHFAIAPAHAVSRTAGAVTHRARRLPSTPSADDFATVFVLATSGYTRTHAGGGVHFTNVHCVQASPGHYMCSYAATGSGRVRECHLVQAQWTPRRESTVTVTLAGRVKRCATLREALHSLQ
jgi:hypothetical protein